MGHPGTSVQGPLGDLRVLDLSIYLPGPYLTRILADLGAEVVKVESPSGDPARYMPPLIEGGAAAGLGAAFAALNYGKRGVVLDLKTPLGREVLLDLVDKSDVVVESFRPGVLDRLGVGFSVLSARQPKLILCSISGYGQRGPLADRAGHDLNYIARAGVLGLFGPPDVPPVVPGVQIADIGGGSLSAAVAILAALRDRDRTGRGQHLDVAMSRGAFAFAHFELLRRTLGDPEPRGDGLLSGGLPCYRVYETRDGRYMALGALEPKFFARFCERAGVSELAGDGFARGPEGGAVVARLTALFRERTQAEWVALLADADACCEPVASPEEAFVDPALGLATANVGGVDVPRAQLGLPLPPAGGVAPRIGEHSLAIGRDWQLDEELLSRAQAAGALVQGEMP